METVVLLNLITCATTATVSIFRLYSNFSVKNSLLQLFSLQESGSPVNLRVRRDPGVEATNANIKIQNVQQVNGKKNTRSRFVVSCQLDINNKKLG